MTPTELADWIDKNYPRLSPYLKVESSGIEVYLDKKLRTIDLKIAWLIRNEGGGWRYVGAGDIINQYSEYYIVKCIARKNQKIDALLNKMKLICEGSLKMIDWYESLPIEEDRAQLIDLGMQCISGWSNRFSKTLPNSGMDLTVYLPNDYSRRYEGRILNLRGGCVEIYAATLDELLDKIMAGEE